LLLFGRQAELRENRTAVGVDVETFHSPQDAISMSLRKNACRPLLLVSSDGEHVTFRWKDYAGGGKQRSMTLTATEFLRRFFLHAPPQDVCRKRHRLCGICFHCGVSNDLCCLATRN
jgi:hypothetical protein